MAKQHYDLDTPLMDFSSKGHRATWTIRDAVEGVQIFGGIGSGKTSGSGRTLALKYLSHGFGGLVLTAKHDEKELWQEYCRIAGRTDDLIIVEPGGKYHFNFLEYESTASGKEKSITMNIVQVLKTVINAGQDSAASSDDSFWQGAMDMLLANTIDLCLLAYGKLTIQHLYEIAQSAPKRNAAQPPAGAPEAPRQDDPFRIAYSLAMDKVDMQVQAWKAKLSATQLNAIKSSHEFTRLASEALPDVRTMGFINNFFTDAYRNIAEKTRSIIDFNLLGFLNNLLREPVYSLFCRNPSNFTPEDCLNGKIILINLPVKDYHKVGRDAQVMFKYIWQRAMERRRIAQNGRPVFLWADESQTFLHEHDAVYQATARSSRIATVYISQNLPNYFAALGGKAGEYRVKSFLGTLGTKIFHANADMETNNYAASLIGQDYRQKDTYSRTVAGDFSTSQGRSWELEYIIRPEEFVSLKTGGPENNYRVEGIMHVQGKQLSKNTNFKRVRFNQNFSLNKTK